VNPDPELVEQLAAALAPAGPHTLYGSVTLADESDFASADLLVQAVGSSLPFALWLGPGLPESPDAEGFVSEAEVAEGPDGSILASLEQRNDSDGEVYEIVRIVAAYRRDGVVVTLNRYADPDLLPAEDSWSAEALRALVLDPRWALADGGSA